jgi:hypothetical protein
MRKLKMFVTAGLATAALAVGGLAVAPSASAQPIDCNTRQAVADAYNVYADLLASWGYRAQAIVWHAKANILVQGCT